MKTVKNFDIRLSLKMSASLCSRLPNGNEQHKQYKSRQRPTLFKKYQLGPKVYIIEYYLGQANIQEMG